MSRGEPLRESLCLRSSGRGESRVTQCTQRIQDDEHINALLEDGTRNRDDVAGGGEHHGEE